MKLHLGCGGHKIEGWENHDIDVDIRKPLPYADGSAEFILCEHCVEHITHQEAWKFFEECYRVLILGGVVRIAVPDLKRLNWLMTKEYRAAVRAGGHGDGSHRSALRAVVFEHGHQAVWCSELLFTFLEAVGFKAREADYCMSRHAELQGVEQHWKTVGVQVAQAETSIVEGTKL